MGESTAGNEEEHDGEALLSFTDRSLASLIEFIDPHLRGRRLEARGAMVSVKGAAVCVGVLAAAGRAMASAGAAAEGEAWNWPHHGKPPLSHAITFEQWALSWPGLADSRPRSCELGMAGVGYVPWMDWQRAT